MYSRLHTTTTLCNESYWQPPVSEMTYSVSSGTLNSTIPYHNNNNNNNNNNSNNQISIAPYASYRGAYYWQPQICKIIAAFDLTKCRYIGSILYGDCHFIVVKILDLLRVICVQLAASVQKRLPLKCRHTNCWDELLFEPNAHSVSSFKCCLGCYRVFRSCF